MDEFPRVVIHQDVRYMPIAQTDNMTNYGRYSDTSRVSQAHLKPRAWHQEFLKEVVSHHRVEPGSKCSEVFEHVGGVVGFRVFLFIQLEFFEFDLTRPKMDICRIISTEKCKLTEEIFSNSGEQTFCGQN